VRLDGVGRRYGLRGDWVLRGVDLALGRGELWRVDGANGAGKSTLLRLLAGIDAPSAGRISRRPRVVAYVPERFPAALPFDALGYLTHLGRVRGLRKRAAARAAAEWLERFGAGRYARTPLAELSKGSCQKVALAQAMLAGPELLVMDEARTGLDRRAQQALDEVVAERVGDGCTVVQVDHGPQRAGVAPAHGVLRVGDGRVVVAELVVAEAETETGTEAAEQPAPCTRIVVSGGDAAALPQGPAVETLPDGAVRLTVPSVEADAVLRVLLAARPPWHVRSVDEGSRRS
jgi:ABC-type Mn2+/Zn2+ transport system ATPase subunit